MTTTIAEMIVTALADEGVTRVWVGDALIGNPAARTALEDCDVLFMAGTDFPYSDWYPTARPSFDSMRGRSISGGARAWISDWSGTVGPPWTRCSPSSSRPIRISI